MMRKYANNRIFSILKFVSILFMKSVVLYQLLRVCMYFYSQFFPEMFRSILFYTSVLAFFSIIFSCKTKNTDNEKKVVAEVKATDGLPRSKETYKRITSAEQYLHLPLIDLQYQKGKGKEIMGEVDGEQKVTIIQYAENYFNIDDVTEYVINQDDETIDEVILHINELDRKTAVRTLSGFLGASKESGKGKNGEDYRILWEKGGIYYELRDKTGKIDLYMFKNDFNNKNQFSK